MRRLIEAILVLTAAVGWATALRERDKAERISSSARRAASTIRHDLQGTTLTRPNQAERWG